MKRMVLIAAVAALMLAVAAGVALADTIMCTGGLCKGTPNPDTLKGTPGFDDMRGLAGADTIYGFGGKDTMDGGDGNDTMRGGRGNDTMRGGTGRDLIYGNVGKDVIKLRRDHGVSVDRVVGGAGNDYISIANVPKRKDVAVCGPGRRDRVVADKADHVSRASCEKVRRIGG